ncbi:MAG: nodulation protein NfeD [Actinobacteria bacterium]|nr:nodulation protein NfeD [Actinomycetota bacterium]
MLPLLPPSNMKRRYVTITLLVAVGLLALMAMAGSGSEWIDLSLATAETGERTAQVWVTRVDGVIDPPLATFLTKTMIRAAEAEAAALIIELDTPGGLDSSMRQIIQGELAAPIPVVIYVWPDGARSASAGVYIMMGADVAAMAPKTNLGAAQPVSLSGEMDEEMKKKVVNDAAAYIRGLAQGSGRNADWAEQAVRESVSLTAEDALSQNVIDFVASDRAALLMQLDGFTTKAKGLELDTAGAEVVEVGMSWWEQLLHVLANPEIAFILLTIGIYGIIFELQTPGLGVSGVLGGLCMLLGLYSLQILPVNYLGLALMALAIGLFIAEVFVQSYGLLAVGGTVALVFGGLLLFDVPDFLRVSWWVLGTVAVCTLAFFLFAMTAVVRARRAQPQTGKELIVGSRAVVVRRLQPVGVVKLSGELWKATLIMDTREVATEGLGVSSPEPAEVGEIVVVVGLEGLNLRVRREHN